MRWNKFMTDDHLTIEAVFDAYFDCRRTKRNSINQLRFEADLESNLVALYRDLANSNYRLGRSIAFIVTHPKVREVWGRGFPGPRGASRYLQRDRRPLLQPLHTRQLCLH